jgi:hypothetical protein
MYSLAVIWLGRVIMGPTEYDIATKTIAEPDVPDCGLP